MGLGARPTNPNPHRMGEEPPILQDSPQGRKQCPYAGSQALPGQAVTFSASVLGHTRDSLSRVTSAVAAQMGHHPQFLPSLVRGTVLSNEFGFTPPSLQVLRRDGVCG